MEGNNVRLCQQLRQQYIRQPIVRRRKFVVCQNAHTEALTDFSKCAPNFASSHNTGCFAVQIEAGEAGKAEIEIAGADIGLVGVPVDREKQCHCVLGHRVRRIRGNAEHPDFPKQARISALLKPAQRRAMTLIPSVCRPQMTASFRVAL